MLFLLVLLFHGVSYHIRPPSDAKRATKKLCHLVSCSSLYLQITAEMGKTTFISPKSTLLLMLV